MLRADVLVVDDDADGRDALSQLLVARGYEVRQAGNGRMALDMMAERMPGYLVLDLEMPVMSGWCSRRWRSPATAARSPS